MTDVQGERYEWAMEKALAEVRREFRHHVHAASDGDTILYTRATLSIASQLVMRACFLAHLVDRPEQLD